MNERLSSKEDRLRAAIDDLIAKPKTSPARLALLAEYCVAELDSHGLPDVRGGRTGELRVEGVARAKDGDVAYRFAGKFRLLISLKSMLKNVAGTVPNRLDDLMGEAANVQQLAPEVVIGYAIVFDVAQDSSRKDGRSWSDHFERALSALAVRGAPLWNQGLIEDAWFIRIDSARPTNERLIEPAEAVARGDQFFESLLRKLAQREPAVPFTKPVEPL